MPLIDINLDDRTFEQLFAEAQRRIPAYTPDWTDQNPSDPGIALLQLFCWLQEMTIWRLNQVPQKNYVKFLELVGQNLTGATPATVELQFTPSSDTLGVGVLVPAGTSVRAASASATAPIIFQTDSDLVVIGGDIAQVQVFDGGSYTVVTQEQAGSEIAYAPFSQQPQQGAALLLGFEQPFPIATATPISFTVHAVQADGDPIVAVGPDPSVTLAATVIWEYYSGDPQNWTPLTLTQDGTLAMTQPGLVQFTIAQGGTPQVAAQFGALQRPTDPLLYWVRARIASIIGPGFLTPPMIQDVQINTVTATNAVSQPSELLGPSSGLPGQTFNISGIPILPAQNLPEPLEQLDVWQTNPGLILVDQDDGNGYVAWKEVEDFNSSSPTDTVYTLDRTTGLVTFGDGKHGAIPRYVTDATGTAEQESNIMAGPYRSGGGAAGNVPANTLVTIDDPVPYLQGVTNPRPASGGSDEETIAQAQQRLPALLRTQNRAVTADDFAALAMLTPGVQIVRAYALSQFNPILSVAQAPLQTASDGTSQFVPFPGVVTVFVIPYSTDPKPTPTEDFCNQVAKHLNQSRLITTEVYVTGPNYREVEVDVAVIVDPSYPLGTVQAALTTSLQNYFNPVTGGDIPEGSTTGSGFPFGGVISITGTLRLIVITTGVVRVVPNSFKVYVDGEQITQDLQIGPSETVYSGQHQIGASYS